MEIEDEQEENEDEMEIDDLILDAEEKKNRLKQKDVFERELDKIVAEYAPDIKNFHIFDQNMMARADNIANSVNEKDHDLKVMVAHLAKIKERAVETGSNTGEMWKLIEGLDSLLRRKTAMNDNLMFSRRIIERDKEVIKSILQKVKDNDKNLEVIQEVQKVYEKNMDKQDIRHEKQVEKLMDRIKELEKLFIEMMQSREKPESKTTVSQEEMVKGIKALIGIGWTQKDAGKHYNLSEIETSRLMKDK